jgi:hypothetical protein
VNQRQLPLFAQRWRDGRASYRPRGEPIATSRYEVAGIGGDATARAFVAAHHYAQSYPAARHRFGLYRAGALAGVAVFSHPVNDRTLTGAFPGVPAADAVELGRFVLLDEVPANGETWFLGRCFDLLRRDGLHGVVSFSDPAPRTTRDGRTVMPGHVGLIYQAHNGAYLGRGKARTLRLLDDGTVFNERAAAKVRGRERGWRAAAARLQTFGADGPWDDTAAWLAHWLGRLTRPLRHPGNFKYAWVLPRRARRASPLHSLPYPKAV